MSQAATYLPPAREMLKPRLARCLPRGYRNERALTPVHVDISLEVIELISAQVDNTPTLAAMLRVSWEVYRIARKHLYHTLELGFAGNPSENNNFNEIIHGFLEGSELKAECLALVHTAFVNSKIFYGLGSAREQEVFPNLHTVVLPGSVQTWPDIFSLNAFRSARHIIVNEARSGLHLVELGRIARGEVELSGWKHVRKVSLYNLNPRDRHTKATDKKWGVIPSAFSALEEIEVWPAFRETERDTSLDIFENIPNENVCDRFGWFTVIVPVDQEDEYAKAYIDRHPQTAAKLCFRQAETRIVEKLDPVLEETRRFREWQ